MLGKRQLCIGMLLVLLLASFTTAIASAQTPVPSPTPQPGFARSLANEIETAVISPFLTLAKLVGILLVLWLILRLLRRDRQIVVESFQNASGAAELDKVAPGLSHRAREALVERLDHVRRSIETYGSGIGPDSYLLPPSIGSPRGKEDLRLSQLAGSLKDVGAKELNPILYIIEGLWPAPVTRVTSTMQPPGERDRRVGLTLEIDDVRTGHSPSVQTLWEPPCLPSADTPGRQSQPADPIEQAVQALRVRKPVEGEREAVALYLLGRVYEAYDVKEAIAKYEESLKKRPDSSEARAALERLLQDCESLSERSATLSGAAAGWLSIELYLRDMLKWEPLGWRVRKWVSKSEYEQLRAKYRAEVYNIAGALQHSAALDQASHFGTFDNCARLSFQRAMELQPGWYQPYENLALLVIDGGHRLESNPAEAQRFYAEALRLLERAQRCLRDISSEGDLRTAERRVIAEAACCKVLRGAPEVFGPEPRTLTPFEAEGWDYVSERNVRLLYGMASLHGLAHRNAVPGVGAEDRVRLYLAFAVARDEQRAWVPWALSTLELATFFQSGDNRRAFEQLREELDRLADTGFEIAVAPPDKVKAAVLDASRRVGWCLSIESFSR